jgi:ureidoglycolate lyase
MTMNTAGSTTRRDILRSLGCVAAGATLFESLPALAQAFKPPTDALPIHIEVPTEQSAAPYGALLGKPYPATGDAVGSFRTLSGVQVWRQQVFDAGIDGKVDIAWVVHKGAEPLVNRFEQHHLTEQAVIPLTGELIQIVALSLPDGAPDLATARAFRLAPGTGLCMGRDVWHASRSNGVTLAMLTRATTSADMAQFQNKRGPLAETSLRETRWLRLVDPI